LIFPAAGSEGINEGILGYNYLHGVD
jgi:hypothetical protein